MKSKINNFLIITGIIIFIVGLYFMFVKAGLPYQDPTPEMTKRWLFYTNFGEIGLKIGFGVSLAGLVFKIMYRFMKEKY